MRIEKRGQTVKRKKIGIRTRVFLEVGAIIAACLIALIVINSQLLESVYQLQAERSMRDAAEEIENAGNNFYSVIKTFESKEGMSIDLYDESDNFLYESGGSFITGTKLNVVSRSEFDDGSYLNILQEEDNATQYILYGADFSDGRHIEITSQKDPIQENAHLATVVTTVISVAALLLSLVFISGYAKRFTKPLIEMSSVTSRMSELDFSEKCKVERNDEIGTLADNINALSSSLSTALTELQEKNEQLLNDIERERQLEKMRHDFVASASHELKTPIAIIRGYAEGLIMSTDGKDESVKEYCDIIINEADRMNNLVLDMLEQSLYSSGVKELNAEDFSISELIGSFMTAAKPMFNEKGITASFSCDSSYYGYGDVKQLTTVISNIVSNACSHASDDKKIIVSVSDEGENYRVSVFNTGSTVEDKDKDSIFTSFYRADKAHSRAEGRFGLGLSIVKSIMDLHKTECGFDNKEDGVSFWFDVNKSLGKTKFVPERKE